jgi:hypothetical protein
MSARARWLVLMCAALAFAQTMAYYIYLRDDPGNYNGAGAGGDQVAYIGLAQQLLHGTWDGQVHYMPGLPAVIAVSQLLFGDPRLGIAVVQAVVFAVLVLATSSLATRAFGPSAGLPAAALVGLNPALGYYAAQALTEFLTGVVLLCIGLAIFAWSKRAQVRSVVILGLLVAASGYLRAEYLGLALLLGLIFLIAGRAAAHAALLVVVVAVAMSPWVLRYVAATGQAALYNESPFSNLILMGTWFRVFDEQTFAQLQQIETAPGPREQAIERASSVGPRPDLSRRYMEQARGPYERPFGETLQLATDNIRLNLRQYLVNHLALAPVLIWAGHTPVRQADTSNLPSSARYAIWAAELALLLLAIWQALVALRDRRTQVLSLTFLGIIVFLTIVHIVIAVDERFTTPALPLIGVFAGARLAQLFWARQRLAVGYA